MRQLIEALSFVLTALVGAGTAWAQDPVTLEADAVLALGLEPWLDRDEFQDRLNTVLGGIDRDMPRPLGNVGDQDPFLWSLTGRFGAAVSEDAAPGGIFICSRYGLETRDRMATSGLSSSEGFALYAATQAAYDDAEVWPENAVARLACTITWNDTRRVAIIPEVSAARALAGRFDHVARSRETDGSGDSDRTYAPYFGPDGYRLLGRGGLRNSVAILESAMIELTMGHQGIRFRAFLLNGGV